MPQLHLAIRNAASSDRARNFLLGVLRIRHKGLDNPWDRLPPSGNDVTRKLRRPDKEKQVQSLCDEHREALKGVAELVSAQGQWDLSLPVAVIDARSRPHQIHQTAAGSIGNVLRISVHVDHPLMRELFVRYEDMGAESAIEHMINFHEEAEEFSQLFSMFQEERRGSAKPMWSADDAAKFVKKSRDAFADREIAVAALLPGEAYELMTWGIPVDFYSR